ncbi:hypothetical protein J3F84DRAFT_400850 [Trichoderma pleuroticola]
MLPRPGSETTKLRTSCQTCALVKVKCTKEKPTCSRCKNRGIACQYFVVKRPGRRRQVVGGTSTATNSTSLTATDGGDDSISGTIQQPSRTSLSPNPPFQDGPGSLADMRVTAPMTNSLTSTASHSGVSMMATSGSCLDHPALSRRFMPNGLSDDDMATIDPLSIFSAFEEASTNLAASVVDVGAEMDGLDFLRPSGVSDRIRAPPRDIASLLMPAEGLAPILEPIRPADTSLCSSRSSSSRSGLSSALFSAGQVNASLTAISTRRTSPAATSDALACQCLDRALHLLKKVSGSSSSSSPSSLHSSSSSQSSRAMTCVSASPDGNESLASFGGMETQPRWSQVALMENRQCLGAMDNILMCLGADEDRMLLLVLCMILLKILDRYSNVAWSRSRPSRGHSCSSSDLKVNMSDYIGADASMLGSTISRATSILGDQDQMGNGRYRRLAISFDLGPSQRNDDDDFGRATAQLVLGELHRVQRVVNQLLPKLKGSRFCNTERQNQQLGGWGGRQQAGALPMEGLDFSPASPFSATLLEHMGSDVRKSLSTLSASIIQRLRQS